MKLLLTSIMICSLVLTSCNKSTMPGKTSVELTGKWKYTQTFYSIGGPLIYESTENLKQWIEFKADGGFASNVPKFKGVTGYKIVDSSKVRLISVIPQTGAALFYFSFELEDNSLSLSPADLVCTEGCGDKFKR